VPLVNVPLFGEQMIALYLLFLAPDELAALLGFFDPRRWFSRRGEELQPLRSMVGASSSLPSTRPIQRTASARLSDVPHHGPPARQGLHGRVKRVIIAAWEGYWASSSARLPCS